MCVQYLGGGGGGGEGVFSTVWDILSTVGGYREYHGDVRYRGRYNLLLLEYLHGTEPPRYASYSPHVSSSPTR